MSPAQYLQITQEVGFSDDTAIIRFFGVNERTHRRWKVSGPPRSVEICLVAMSVSGLQPPALAEAVGLYARGRRKAAA